MTAWKAQLHAMRMESIRRWKTFVNSCSSNSGLPQ
jgi:hypothetical protein